MGVEHNKFRAAKPELPVNVGISGLGTNPTNPWCQRPRRPPLQYKTCLAVLRYGERAAGDDEYSHRSVRERSK
jgi:hypothetical protein